MSSNISNSHVILSYGALEKMLDGETVQNVVLQILGYKQISGNSSNRFRLLLNDGENLFQNAILATQLNNLIYEKTLEKYTIFKLKNYAFNEFLANKKVIICIDIEIIVPGSQVNVKIGTNKRASLSNQVTNVVSTPMSVPEHNVFNYVESCPSTSDVSQNWDTARMNHVESTSESESLFISSICSITPYRNKWRIRARVTYKTPIASYSNMRGQGKYFSFYLLDDSGEIRATAFNENAEKLFDLLEPNKIYLISNASVKRARGDSSVKNDFELVIENKAKVEPYMGDETSVPMLTFKFCTVAEIASLPKDSFTDVIGICDQVSDSTTVITKLNKEISKRTLTLVDDSGKSVTVTLWGADAENFKLDSNNVLAIKNAKVTNFGGCSLSVTSTSMISINPEVPKTFELRSWFRNLDASASRSVSSDISLQRVSQKFKTLAEVYTDTINNNEMSLYYSTKATIVTVKKEKSMYQACPHPSCLKKVIDLNNGFYKCNKCNKEYDTFNWILLLFLEIADFTSSQWTVAFRETAENLIGMSSEALSKIKNENEDKYYEILSNLDLKSYIFKMRSNIEVFNEETRLKTSILNFSPVDIIPYTKRLMADIKRLGRIINNV